MLNNVHEIWDFIIDNEIASEETLQVVTNLNGYSAETLNEVLYVVTGYRSIEQYQGEE
jgi:hypothetical protein